MTDSNASAAATSASEAAKSRIRLAVEHPFENGRLIVWIDGVLVHEMKLQAPVSKKGVFKVREGRAEKILDLEPGRHEVRVEVTWSRTAARAGRWSTPPPARPACWRSAWAA